MTIPLPAGPLSEVLGALETKGLRRGIGPMPGRPAPAALSSGQPALDSALGTGGWPCGALAALEGSLGCGAVSLGLSSVVACQRSGGLAAWLDLDRSFDAAGAARAGVDLEWLLVVRPETAGEAVELAAWLVRSRLVDLVMLDLQLLAGGMPRGVGRLAQLLARSEAVALLLSASPIREAAVRVTLERRVWLAVGRDLVGQRVTASVRRHRRARSDGHAELDLWFSEGRRVDPLLPSLAEPRPALDPGLRVLSA